MRIGPTLPPFRRRTSARHSRFRMPMIPARSAVLAASAILALLAAIPRAASPAEAVSRTPAASPGDEMARIESAALGHSGKLRVLFTDPSTPLALPLVWKARPAGDVVYSWQPLAGTRPPLLLGTARLSDGIAAPAVNGIWRLRLSAGAWRQDLDGISVITRVPFGAKRGGWLNGYHIGTYPTEGGEREDMYAPPPGFIEVTPENEDTPVSEHFRLRDFLTKDQRDLWPKYLALDLRLVDKLELVMLELNAMGIRAERLAVMSGYRTPQYNANGASENRARLSRHMYGDASDVWVDNDANGWMDDLNGDGRIDDADGEVIRRAVNRVEAAWPDLTGGCGVYLADVTHPPFVHIDARGRQARW
jgi:hypothetical protein